MFKSAHTRHMQDERIDSSFVAMSGAIIWSLVVAMSLPAADWPQWRGPTRDGVWAETGIVEAFPAKGLTIRWRAAVGAGWSSPVVAGGRVYLSDSQLVRPQARERIHCFDAGTGQPVWTFAYDVNYPDWAFTKEQNGGPCATPIVEAGRVYVLGGNGHVHCLDARTGARIWDVHLEKTYEISVLQCRPSPLIDGKLLIMHVGGKPGASVIALDKDTGKEVWKALDDPVSNSSPIIVAAGGARQLIVWTGESIASLDPATGKTWWRERLVTSNNDAIPTPVCQGELLLIGGLMMKLDSNKPAAAILWPDSKAVSRRVLSNTSTACLHGGHVYSARSSGHLVCLDAKTGKQLWETDKVTDLKTGPSIHITRNGDVMFLYTDRGELIRAQLTALGYKELGRSRILEPVYPFGGRNVAWSPPAFANRCVFARSEKELVCASLAAVP